MNNVVFAIGMIGQALFTGRVLIQWVASERAKTSVVPTSYWVFSLAGSLLLLTYALLKKDPVFILGQAFGIVVYLRNLQMIRRPAFK